jgi:hypothetical protein
MMAHTDFDNILDECLARLGAGESIDACLRKHPEYAAALRPLLSAAADLIALPRPEPGAGAIEAGRRRMLTAFREQKRAREGSISSVSRHAGRIREFFVLKQPLHGRHILRFSVAMVLALFVGIQLAVVASAGAIPGDPLYGVKRSWEEARLVLTLREQDREQLREQLGERRRGEVREMIRQGREGTLDLDGLLQAAEDGQWVVDGLPVRFTETTIVDGRLEPGVPVWVRAQVLDDGTLVAVRVRTAARRLPVGGTGLSVTPDDMPNRRLVSSATPTPSPTPEPIRSPQPTGTPRATSSPRPEATPAPGETLRADEAPEPIEDQEPEHTPEPTRSSDAGEEPGPTATREHDDEAEPTETREPDHEAEPTETREPDHAAEPTETHEPDHAAEPTETRVPDATAQVTTTREPAETHESDNFPEPSPTPGLRSTPAAYGEPPHTPEAGIDRLTRPILPHSGSRVALVP